MKTRKIIQNALKTPDGTFLISFHRHDYQTHIDKTNKKIYSVDGGRDYLKRQYPVLPWWVKYVKFFNPKYKHKDEIEDFTLYEDDDFEKIRQNYIVVLNVEGKKKGVKLYYIHDLILDILIKDKKGYYKNKNISYEKDLLIKENEYRIKNGIIVK